MTAQASDLGRVAARGSGVTLAAQAIRIALHFLTIVALSRLLSPADFGLVALVTAIVGVSEVLRDLGLSMAAVQAPTLTRGQKSNLFWINALSGLLFALVAFLLAGPIASLFGEAELYEITVWISLVFLINGLSAQFRAEINRKMRFLRLSAVDVVSQAVARCVWPSGWRRPALATGRWWRSCCCIRQAACCSQCCSRVGSPGCRPVASRCGHWSDSASA